MIMPKDQGYLLLDGEALESACIVTKKYNKIVITGYKKSNKNRALIFYDINMSITPELHEILISCN